MKNLKNLCKALTLILGIATLSTISSCSKKDDENKACLAIFMPDKFRFSFINKITGDDLFFSNRPIYTTEQLYAVFDNQTTQLKPKVENLLRPEQHFSLSSETAAKSGTIKLYLDNQLKFTIDYTMKKADPSHCAPYIFDQLLINGTQKEVQLKDRVIQLKL